MKSQDIAYGYAIGYNDGIQNGGGSGGNEEIYAVIADESMLNVITTPDRTATPIETNEHVYLLETDVVSNSVTTQTTSGDTTTTTTATFTAEYVKNVYDSDNELMYHVDVDDTGKITHVFDGENNEIYLELPEV
jgi:hypothetical protein